MIAWGNHLELVEHRFYVRHHEPVEFFVVRRPFVPTQSKRQGQAGRDLPAVVKIKVGLCLAEVEKPTVVLVGQVVGEPQEQIRKS